MSEFVLMTDYVEDVKKYEAMLRALMNQLTEHDRKIAALERRLKKAEKKNDGVDLGYDHQAEEAWETEQQRLWECYADYLPYAEK